MYVSVPPQTKGLGLLTGPVGPVGVSVFPQLSVTDGGVTRLILISVGHITVAAPGGGMVKSSRSIVQVYVHENGNPEQSR